MTDKNSLAEKGDENIIFLSEHLEQSNNNEDWVDDFLGDLDLTPFWETNWGLDDSESKEAEQSSEFEKGQDIQNLMDSIKSQIGQLKGSSEEMAYYLRELDLYTRPNKKH